MHNVQVKDVNSGTVLFECPIEDLDLAYQYAAEIEAYGAHVIVRKPNITQTLANGLGLNEAQRKQLDDSAREEIEDHEGQEICDSCTYSISDTPQV